MATKQAPRFSTNPEENIGYAPMYVRIEGTHPQLMHNGRLKNPLDEWSKEIRKWSSKRKKTDDDHLAMQRAEYMGSLYLYDEENRRVPYWPADNIHACIKTAAKARKLGKVIDEAVMISPPGGRLTYEGPKDAEGLWKNPKFRLLKPTSRGTMCCRPMFTKWSMEFSLAFLEERIDQEELQQLIIYAGRFIGISDWPRRYGLFIVRQFERQEVMIDVGE